MSCWECLIKLCQSKWECPKCGSFNPVTENKCQDCGYKSKYIKKNTA